MGIPNGQDARDRGMDNFLLTFARRVDTRDTWRALVIHAKKRAEELKAQGITEDLEINMYERLKMIQQKSKTLPNLPPWHHPPEAKAVRFMIDGILLLGLAYGGHFVTTSVTDYFGEEEEKQNITGKDSSQKTEEEGNKKPDVRGKEGNDTGERVNSTDLTVDPREGDNHHLFGPLLPSEVLENAENIVIRDRNGKDIVNLDVLLKDAVEAKK